MFDLRASVCADGLFAFFRCAVRRSNRTSDAVVVGVFAPEFPRALVEFANSFLAFKYVHCSPFRYHRPVPDAILRAPGASVRCTFWRPLWRRPLALVPEYQGMPHRSAPRVVRRQHYGKSM